MNVFDFITGKRKSPVADPPSTEKPATPAMPASDPLTALGNELVAVGRDFGRNSLVENDRDKQHLENYAYAQVENLYRKFDPASNPADARVVERVQQLTQRRDALVQEFKEANTLREKLALEMPPPPRARRASFVAVASAILLYGFGSGMSVLPLFSGMDDDVIALTLALSCGLALGALVVFSILQIDQGGEK